MLNRSYQHAPCDYIVAVLSVSHFGLDIYHRNYEAVKRQVMVPFELGIKAVLDFLCCHIRQYDPAASDSSLCSAWKACAHAKAPPRATILNRAPVLHTAPFPFHAQWRAAPLFPTPSAMDKPARPAWHSSVETSHRHGGVRRQDGSIGQPHGAVHNGSVRVVQVSCQQWTRRP
jgi:hypothetical protein